VLVGVVAEHVGVVILHALLAIIGAFVALAVTGHATNIITSLVISLQAAVLPVAVIAAGMWIAYSAGDGLYGAALAAVAIAAAMLTMAGIMVAVGDPHADRDARRAHLAILMAILAILPIFSTSTNAMDSFVTMA
jgi:Na+/H+-translocating membrane pyrophosphatase